MSQNSTIAVLVCFVVIFAGVSMAVVLPDSDSPERERPSTSDLSRDVLFFDMFSNPTHVLSSDWVIQTIDPDGAGSVDMALDGLGRPHLAYSHGRYVRYAMRDGGGWSIADVAEGGLFGMVSIATDTMGRPHIVYHELSSRHIDLSYLRHVWYEEGKWVGETIGYNHYLWSDIALDRLGNTHVVYSTAHPAGDPYFTREDLWYAVKVNGRWSVELIDSAVGWLSGCPSVVLDSFASPHVVYRAFTAKGESPLLKYATKKDGTVWHIEAIDRTSRSCPSIFVDSSSRPHIVYVAESGASEEPLIYLQKEDGGWVGEIIVLLDLTGDCCVGSISLFLDRDERPHVAYADQTGEDHAIRYAFRTEKGWIIDTVESGSKFIGGYLALGLDGEDTPHIAYYRWPRDEDAVVYATKQRVKQHVEF